MSTDAYTDRPLLPADSGNAALPDAEDASGMRDVGRNGTYLVLRQLQQDVRGFWQFIDRQSAGDPLAREQLAWAMVGRTRKRRSPGRIESAAHPRCVDVHAFEPVQLRLGYNGNTMSPSERTFAGRTLAMLTFRPAPAVSFPNSSTISASVSWEFVKTLCRPPASHRVLRRGREYGPGIIARAGCSA